MFVNADFSRRTLVTPDQYVWVPSPQKGVERVMLDRIGAEKARATSLVRYAPDSVFPEHGHPGGEEILVLSGTFSERAQDFPQGWYLRNPPGSAHQPSSVAGAVIFVKLMQMSAAQAAPIRIDTNDPANWQASSEGAVCRLFEDATERVELRRLDENAPLSLDSPRSSGQMVELLVLRGELSVDNVSHPRGSWIRLPAGDTATLVAGATGATVFFKTYVPPVIQTEA